MSQIFVAVRVRQLQVSQVLHPVRQLQRQQLRPIALRRAAAKVHRQQQRQQHRQARRARVNFFIHYA
jgi:tRNA U34 2-thiouridine synthase MnmA/TrmU